MAEHTDPGGGGTAWGARWRGGRLAGRPGCQLSGRPGQTSSRLPDLNRSPSSPPHGAGVGGQETCPDASSFLPSLLRALRPAGVRLPDPGWSLLGSPVLLDGCLHGHVTQAHSPLGTGRSPRVPRPRERVLEGEVAGVSSVAPDRLHGGRGPFPARHPPAPRTVSPTVTPAAQPCTDPRPGPPPGPSLQLRLRFPVAEAPLGSYLLLGAQPAASSQRPSGKMARFPRPRRQSRLPCDSAGLELGPATRCPHVPPRGLEGRRAQRGSALAPQPPVKTVGPGHWGIPPALPTSGLSGTCLLPGASEGPGPKSLEQPADPGFPCGRCQLALPRQPLLPQGASNRKRNNPCLAPIGGSKLGRPFTLLMHPSG